MFRDLGTSVQEAIFLYHEWRSLLKMGPRSQTGIFRCLGLIALVNINSRNLKTP